MKRESKTIFVTATDTGVGKTITTALLAAIFKAQGVTVGVMKPVQCAGHDAAFLKRVLALEDRLALINPCYAPEPLSPHLALRRAKIKFDRRQVLDGLKELQARYDIVLVEGAGGLMVPLSDGYYNADLIADMQAQVIIVARPGLGTINHTLLTVNEAKRHGLKIKGLVFCHTRPGKKSLPERTNPQEIEKLSGVKVLGIIPYLKTLTRQNIHRQCQQLKLDV